GSAPVADGPVADLIVVLAEHHESMARQPGRRAAVMAPPVGRPLSVVYPCLSERLGEQLEGSEVLGAAGAGAGAGGVEGVVPLARPQGGQAEPAGVARANHPGVIA